MHPYLSAYPISEDHVYDQQTMSFTLFLQVISMNFNHDQRKYYNLFVTIYTWPI
jgi:hypothetical protein